METRGGVATTAGDRLGTDDAEGCDLWEGQEDSDVDLTGPEPETDGAETGDDRPKLEPELARTGPLDEDEDGGEVLNDEPDDEPCAGDA
jgi:hypothetical protein